MKSENPRQMGFDRVPALEGLRGLAAIQVFLLHYISCLTFAIQLPPIQTRWQHLLRAPLILLVDGSSAVYVFFVLSGAVLTMAFAQSRAGWAAELIRRVVRLGVPVAGAVLLGFFLLRLWPHSHVEAASIAHSELFLGPLYGQALTWRHLARELLCNGLILGYRESSLFSQWPDAVRLLGIQSVADAFVPPLWSLHFELYGSILVLLLTRLQRRGPWRHRAAVLACFLVFGGNPLQLFVLGHLAAGIAQSGRIGSRGTQLEQFGLGISLPLILLGAAICADKNWGFLKIADEALLRTTLFAPPMSGFFQSAIGALLLTLGIFLNPWLRRQLSRRPAAYLGRLSFSFYLVHYPLMTTVMAWIYVRVFPFIGMDGSAMTALVLGLPLSLTVAAAFERFINRPAIWISRLFTRASQPVPPRRSELKPAGFLPLRPVLFRQPWIETTPPPPGFSSTSRSAPTERRCWMPIRRIT